MIKRICGFLGLMVLFLTAGCTVHHNMPAVSVNIVPPVVQKIPLKVAVVVPEPNSVMTKNEGIIETVPAGQLINRQAQRVFPYVFRDAEIVSGGSRPGGIDAAIVLSIQDFSFTGESVALGFGMKYIAEVSLKAVLTDEKGTPLWEHVATASKASRSVVSPVIPEERLKGESFAEALAEAFTGLAQEMERSREIRAYAASKGAPEAAPQVSRVQAPAPSLPIEAARPEPGKLPPLRPGTHALVIGIDYRDRQDIPNLLYASQDARKVYDVLTDARYGGVPKENAILLLNEQATRNGMVAALRKMKAWDGYIYLY